MKTIQGDTIQQLVDGYINIALNERRPQRPSTPDEEDVQIVDSVNPKKSVTHLFYDGYAVHGLLNLSSCPQSRKGFFVT